jgi:hypothetical protein
MTFEEIFNCLAASWFIVECGRRLFNFLWGREMKQKLTFKGYKGEIEVRISNTIEQKRQMAKLGLTPQLLMDIKGTTDALYKKMEDAKKEKAKTKDTKEKNKIDESIAELQNEINKSNASIITDFNRMADLIEMSEGHIVSVNLKAEGKNGREYKSFNDLVNDSAMDGIIMNCAMLGIMGRVPQGKISTSK